MILDRKTIQRYLQTCNPAVKIRLEAIAGEINKQSNWRSENVDERIDEETGLFLFLLSKILTLEQRIAELESTT